MSITLNGVTLDEDLLWENEFDDPTASQSKTTSLGGRAQHQAMPLDGGRELQITAIKSGGEVYGVLTRAQVQQLKALELAGTEVAFVYETQTFQVKVKAGSVQMRPHQARPNQAATDEYAGSFTLLEV